MKKLLAMASVFAGCAFAQQSFPALRAVGESVEPNAAGTNGGYLVFRPVEYNPYGGAVCHDQWTNPVQQPLPAVSATTFGLNDLVLWSSLSPSMPFSPAAWSGITAYAVGDLVVSGGVDYIALIASTGVTPAGNPATWTVTQAYGLVQSVVYNAISGGPCGSPLPVNANYGLNTNGYFFGRAGLATDAPSYNSIQSLQGGILGNSLTMGTWYPTGTTVCTNYNGSSCTATAPITAGLCPGGAVGCYLGGHVDVGHSVGPPAAGGIASTTNPYSGGEGEVAGQLYFEDGSGVYPTYYPCLRVSNGSSFDCVGAVSDVYNSFADRASSPATTAAFQTSGGTMKIFGSGDFQGQTYKASTVFNSLADTAGSPSTTPAFTTSTGTMTIWGSGDAQFQTVKASSTFNSLATGATAAFQQYLGTFVITGAGNAAFQSVTLTNGLTVDSGAYGVSATGDATFHSCTGCGAGGVTSWNTRTGAVTLTAADVAAVEQDLRTSASPAFAAATATTFNCSATSTTDCITQSSGTWGVTGAGNAAFQNVVVTSTFNSLAAGATAAIQQSSGTFSITGAGNAAFQSLALTNGMTVDSGTYGFSGSGALVAASAAAPIFNCSATGSSNCMQQSSGTWSVTGAGNAALQSVALTNGLTVDSGAYGFSGSGALTAASAVAPIFNCSATGSSNCMQQSSGTWSVTGAGNAAFQSVALADFWDLAGLSTAPAKAALLHGRMYVDTSVTPNVLRVSLNNVAFNGLIDNNGAIVAAAVVVGGGIQTGTPGSGGTSGGYYVTDATGSHALLMGVTGSTCSQFTGGICTAP